MTTGGSALLPLTVAVPVLGGCAVAASHRLPRWITDTSALAIAVAVATLDAVTLDETATRAVVTWSGGWRPRHGTTVGITMYADRYAAGIALLAAVLMTCALLYSWKRFESAGGRYQALMLLFLAGMQGFALSGDLFDLFVFFELMGAAAYALTALKIEELGPLQGGLNFAIVNSLGAYFSLMGIALLYGRTGHLGLAAIGETLSTRPADALVVAAFALVACGLLVKAAIVPFHFWLDDAHAVAPTPVCVILSGVMVELGLYGLARISIVVFGGAIALRDIGHVLMVLGAVTAVLGALMCWQQRHLKRLLAFSTIAHMGLFTMAVATFTTDGLAGAALYVTAHAAVKAALFLMAGILLNRLGTVDEGSLFGRGRTHPILGGAFVLAALALAGLPPFGTALGKGIAEAAVASAGDAWGPVVFVAVSALTGAAVLRAAIRIFHGGRATRPRTDATSEEEQPEVDEPVPPRPWNMAVPIAALLVGALVVGVLPGSADWFTHGASQFLERHAYLAASLGRPSEHAPHVQAAGWTTSAVVLGSLSTAIAVVVAAIALTQQEVGRRLGLVGRAARRSAAALRATHSGHVGDYVTWLLVGTATVFAILEVSVRS